MRQSLRSRENAGTRGKWIGLLGLLIFSFSASPFPNVAGIGLGLLLILFIINRARHVRREDPLVLLLAALLFYLVISVLIGWSLFPDRLYENVTGAAYILSLPLFVLLVAWALEGDKLRINLVLLAAFCGFLIAVLLPLISGSVGWDAFFAGDRESFMFGSPIRLGLYSATVLLGLLIWFPKWRVFNISTVSGLVAYLLLIALTLQALIVSQARIAWVGALLVVPIIIGIHVFLEIRRKRFSVKSIAVVFTAGALLASTVLYLNVSTIENRVLHENATVQAAIRGGEVEFTSIGIRIHMWRLGIEKIAERPWLGHGPASVHEFLSLRSDAVGRFSHMHNMAIDLLVRTGIVGLLFVIGIFLLLFVAVVVSWRAGRVDNRILLFTIGALVLFIIDGASGYPLSRTQGRFFLALIGGIAYTSFLYRHSPDRGNA